MATDTKLVLSKIKKLLALSTSSNPNEAAAAAAKAQELLMLHNLSMSQIQTQEPSSYEQTFLNLGRSIWKRVLLSVIARNNFCEVVYTPSKAESALIGEAHNREVVTYLYHYLIGQLEPMAIDAYHRSLSSMHAKSWLDAFYMGAATSIDHRLEEQQREMEAASNACKALIISKDAELKSAMRHFYPQTKNGSSKRIRSKDGYYSGQEAGRKVALNRGIEA
ncbi:MAG TPA: DUF2786 domain-containing protein [Ktedonobacteraceae bacterium]|nr:DUF2786 domain-containing protein [Ktedonobacteraceae bacterium]